jgi:rare lipoprotein A
MRHGLVLRGVAVLVAAVALASCAQRPTAGFSKGGQYKVGKPYQVNGIWYTPAEDFSYNETGIASWYGPGFHQKTTANGEIYDQEELTAAHKTLPMPSLVRVTNLDNGRSIVVRVNDRGPFVNGRIIDMTHRGAQLLGYEKSGTAKVRVEILGEESRAIALAARTNTPAPVLAETDGVPPTAAPRGKVDVATLGGSDGRGAPVTLITTHAAPSVVASAVYPPDTIPGSVSDGRFLPAPVVVNTPVGKQDQIYVQAGSFTQADNAHKLKARLGGAINAAVSQAMINGTRFYRVRIGPMDSVERADSVLNRVVQTGLADAKIVVD